tara:strand:- start:6423 stop:6668 length:246 start_codon:yes stop_codon:yes gene_type:complete
MKKIDDIITHAILQILLEARRQGKDMLSFEEVMELLGMDDTSLMTKFEKESVLVLNKDMLDQLDDPEMVEAMVQSLQETKH